MASEKLRRPVKTRRKILQIGQESASNLLKKYETSNWSSGKFSGALRANQAIFLRGGMRREPRARGEATDFVYLAAGVIFTLSLGSCRT